MFKNIIVAVLLLLISGSCHAQVSGERVPPLGQAKNWDNKQQWRWASEPWTSNDSAYRAIKVAFEKAVKAKQNPEKLVSKYATDLKTRPKDAKAFFRWAYATYRTGELNASFAQSPKYRELLWSMRDFQRLHELKSYEFSRLRFLVEFRYFPTEKLIPAGDRLLRRNSKDYTVKYFLIEVLSGTLSKADKKRAIIYAQEMIKHFPRHAGSHAAMGGAYYSSWLGSNNPDEARRAIAAYKTYLRLAPANDKFRGQAIKLVKLMESGLQRQQKS